MAMDDEKIQRKITAIFHADVVGYSKLMRDDEMATVNTMLRTQGTYGHPYSAASWARRRHVRG